MRRKFSSFYRSIDFKYDVKRDVYTFPVLKVCVAVGDSNVLTEPIGVVPSLVTHKQLCNFSILDAPKLIVFFSTAPF